MTDLMAGEALSLFHVIVPFLFIKCGKSKVGGSGGFVHSSGSERSSVVAGFKFSFKVHDPITIVLSGMVVPRLNGRGIRYDVEFNAVA